MEAHLTRTSQAAVLALLVAAACLALAGCAGLGVPGSPTATPSAPPREPKPTLPAVTTQAECASAGGEWGIAGISGRRVCFFPADDAGRPCSSSAECLGDCRRASTNDAFTCSRYRNDPFGCYQLVERSQEPLRCTD